MNEYRLFLSKKKNKQKIKPLPKEKIKPLPKKKVFS
jgi:hypothetical protein